MNSTSIIAGLLLSIFITSTSSSHAITKITNTQRVYFENGCSFKLNSNWILASGTIDSTNGKNIARGIKYNADALFTYEAFSDDSIEVKEVLGFLPYEIDFIDNIPESVKKYFPRNQAQVKNISEGSMNELYAHYKKSTKANFPHLNKISFWNNKDYKYISFTKNTVNGYWCLISRFHFIHTNNGEYEVGVIMIPINDHITGFYYMHPVDPSSEYPLDRRENLLKTIRTLEVTRLSINKQY